MFLSLFYPFCGVICDKQLNLFSFVLYKSFQLLKNANWHMQIKVKIFRQLQSNYGKSKCQLQSVTTGEQSDHRIFSPISDKALDFGNPFYIGRCLTAKRPFYVHLCIHIYVGTMFCLFIRRVQTCLHWIRMY